MYYPKTLDVPENLRLKDGFYLKCAAILLFHPDPKQQIIGHTQKSTFLKLSQTLFAGKSD